MPDFLQVLTLRNLVLTRLNQTDLFSFSAHVGSLTPLHGIEHGISQRLNINGFRLCRLWNFTVHDSVLEFDTKGWPDAHARHLLHIDTLFELLQHAGLEELDLSLCLLL